MCLLIMKRFHAKSKRRDYWWIISSFLISIFGSITLPKPQTYYLLPIAQLLIRLHRGKLIYAPTKND
jgi:uncharacterized membrane protein YhaH (DUF805 family)